MAKDLDILGFEEDKAIADEELRFKSLQLESDIKKVISIPEGRRVMWRVMSFAGLVTPSFIIDNPHGTSYNEGKRSVGIEVCKWINKADVSSFARIQMEAIALQKQEIAERKARDKERKKNKED